MGQRYESFAPGELYHVYTRGVEKRNIFLDDTDRKRFLDLLLHCLPPGPIQSYSIAKRFKREPVRLEAGSGVVNMMCYCLMSNHIHLLLQENLEGGISLYMQRLLNSYARYFNVRRQRVGPLFVGRFRAVNVDADEQLLHLSRYIHLNPYVAHIVASPFEYRWSSLGEYVRKASESNRCHTTLIKSMMSFREYRDFVSDATDYARAKAEIKYITLD